MINILRIKESTGKKVNSPKLIAEEMSEEARADRECLWALHLNTQHEIVEKELVSMGTLNSLNVHPREVFRRAVINSAHSIVLVHNHPSGLTAPSKEDLTITRQLCEAGKILEIPILDHVILGSDGGFTSFKEVGYI